MAAAFALHAQGVNDTLKNKISRDAGTHLCFFNSPDSYAWDNDANWCEGDHPGGNMAERIPASNDIVHIAGKCNIPVGAEYEAIIIEDGGQLRIPVGMGLEEVTVKKRIDPYTPHIGESVLPNGWYLISLPVNVPDGNQSSPDNPNDSPFCSYENFTLGGNFDFYIYDQYEKLYDADQFGDPDPTGEGEWRNYKRYVLNEVDHLFVADYNGYLYANSETTYLSCRGNLYNSSQKTYSNLRYNSANENEYARGVNLIGNPYACNALVQGVNIKSFYKMNDDRNNVVVIDPSENMIIAPMTALFAVVEQQYASSSSVTFTPAGFVDENQNPINENIRGNGVEGLTIELTADGILQDRVYMKAGEGENGRKFSMSNLTPQIYVPARER